MSHPVCRDARKQAPTEAELEARADQLLWQADGQRPRDLEYSYRREASLTRAARRDRVRAEPPPPVPGSDQETLGKLLEALLAEACPLDRHRRVLSLARRGLSHQQIAEAMGVQRSTATRWHQQALAQLRQYCVRETGAEAAANLRQAYREQTALIANTRECHCAPGREACRADGLCKYRWYLHREASVEW
ncbi:MAG: helix-turn-helix domain-containing protein [Armatimonadetes bacterium]|nr:helix-turn-helix domain-containing protein [Armatimonadota bacterium]